MFKPTCPQADWDSGSQTTAVTLSLVHWMPRFNILFLYILIWSTFYLLWSPSELTLVQAWGLSTVQARCSETSLSWHLDVVLPSVLCPPFNCVPEHIWLTHGPPSGPLQSRGSDKQDVPPPNSSPCSHHREDPRPRPSKSRQGRLQRPPSPCSQQVSHSIRPLGPLSLRSLIELPLWPPSWKALLKSSPGMFCLKIRNIICP